MSEIEMFRQLTIYRWTLAPVVRQLSVMKYYEIFSRDRPELEALIESGKPRKNEARDRAT